MGCPVSEVLCIRLVLIGSLLFAFAHPAPALAHNHHRLAHWFHSSGAECVHHAEGAWDSNTGNGYYGGFQMSLWFQHAYAPRRFAVAGTADHWTIWHQMGVVRRVVRQSGWGQWPNTARYCGLL